jgi:sugar phosphate isomerase/epimerase
MKSLLLALLLVPLSTGASSVSGHLGLELYSLRVINMQKGWRAALDEARTLGFTTVEGGSPPKGITVDEYRAELAKRGLTMVSAHYSYERLTRDAAGAVAEAKALGVQYACVAWIPHEGDIFTMAETQKAAADFNAWGAAFQAAGITFAYHPHGYEFRTDTLSPEGTLFDWIVAETNPAFVSFELDVFWAVHGGADPTRLMQKYPGRWRLMHVKDIRKGAPTHIYTGHAPGTDDVPVGTGQVDWPKVLKEAKAVGIAWYFIEDESPTPLDNVPESVAYLKSLDP